MLYEVITHLCTGPQLIADCKGKGMEMKLSEFKNITYDKEKEKEQVKNNKMFDVGGGYFWIDLKKSTCDIESRSYNFV